MFPPDEPQPAEVSRISVTFRAFSQSYHRTGEFLLELSIRLRLSVLNKASQNAFVKLNKAVEVSNGVEIITVAMAGAGAGLASAAL